MTWHEGEPTDEAFRLFRAALEPLELSGKLQGVLLQYHPRFTKSVAAEDELARAPERLAPLVPLVEFATAPGSRRPSAPTRSRSSRRTGSRSSRWTARAPGPRTSRSPRVAAATHQVAYVRYGRNAATWNIRGARSAAERFDWLYTPEELAEWVEPIARLAGEAEEVYALFNNNRDDFAPPERQILRGLLDEAGIPAAGGVEPPPTELRLF